MTAELRFRFGENWQSFRSSAWTAARVAQAVRGLDALVGRDALVGKSFLDIGSGSGLHSLAAKKLGASRIVSFDSDAEAVACTKDVSHGGWEVLQGSVLDDAFMRSLGTFDVVYAWGVLHHTGDMWRAIEHATIPTRSNGHFALAIYNHVKGKPLTLSSESWRTIKRAYSSGGTLRQKAMLASYVATRFFLTATSLRNPLRDIREYERERGMSWMHDARDWIGGYPYEFTTARELERFVAERGFRAVRRIPIYPNGSGNNQLLFEKIGR
jgi:2-polyprenyl-3-methyl-5-hydroxy-6-metoxy-1,4-benzoquinol methylase